LARPSVNRTPSLECWQLDGIAQNMKKSPDLVLVLVLVFVVGALMTGVSQTDVQFTALVQQVFNS
jgi:hypothetical protein